MSDIGGNVRYYGAKPNNYIYFNCDDYSNQTSDTCELWRIIGVFNDKVKIIRNESIGSYSWDNKLSGVGSSVNRNGSNDWTDARLMMLLNPGYESISNIYSYEGSLYWNRKAGTCYSGSNNGTVSCDFTSSGLKNDITKNMIADVTWNLGGVTSGYSNEIYRDERGTKVYSSRYSLSWNGKIALMYPSDYGYATDFSKCTLTLNKYGNSTNSYACKNNDWLWINENQWLLTHLHSFSYYVYAVRMYGLSSAQANSTSSVHPTLFLDSELKVEPDGDGSSTSPYKLIVN